MALRATNPGISDADLDVYRAPYPYPDPASRRPLLQWRREIPLEGQPADVHQRFLAFGHLLASAPHIPKLLLTTGTGGLVSPDIEAWAREHIVGLDVESIGPAGHHAPEDQPDAIGQAIQHWLYRHGTA